MNLDLTGRTALVCGSTQGLGLASAMELALLGAHVVLMARNENSLQQTLSQLDTSKGQQHDYLVADFAHPAMVEQAIQGYIAKGKTIHILVNNSGGPAGGKAIDAQLNEFVNTFQQHLLCNHVLAQAVVPGMKASCFGRIINIISTSVKQPIAGLGVSNTIRGAVANWSKTLATELGPYGITVNNVLPGFTQTARAEYVIKKKAADAGKSEENILKELVAEIPAGRIGQPQEFGAVVAFLSTPAAGYVNGINLPVDGGRLTCL